MSINTETPPGLTAGRGVYALNVQEEAEKSNSKPLCGKLSSNFDYAGNSDKSNCRRKELVMKFVEQLRAEKVRVLQGQTRALDSRVRAKRRKIIVDARNITCSCKEQARLSAATGHNLASLCVHPQSIGEGSFWTESGGPVDDLLASVELAIRNLQRVGIQAKCVKERAAGECNRYYLLISMSGW
jgi:hypothetical protein